MEKILRDIRQALKDNVEEKVLAMGASFFKEEVKFYGVRTLTVTKIGREAYKEIKDWPKEKVFELCEELWKSGYNEEAWIACNLSYYICDRYEPADFKIFERWVHQYVTNWASCDTLCNHTVGTFIEMYPDYIKELKRWTLSENRWVKRAAAVTLIIPARKGLFLKDIFEIADIMLLDKDDLVQKGYGWMLKAASLSEPTAAAKKPDPATQKMHLEAVFNYVLSKKAVMPRTALRYAIEKMPKDMRAEAMKK
ncbi:MAG: DNA alkylation repair protein [Prevotella sp.]|jgi:3-methyladenine DNA glycosylase AlkD|nr:DNA alkylation repair protein [Prevotella sp.]